MATAANFSMTDHALTADPDLPLQQSNVAAALASLQHSSSERTPTDPRCAWGANSLDANGCAEETTDLTRSEGMRLDRARVRKAGANSSLALNLDRR